MISKNTPLFLKFVLVLLSVTVEIVSVSHMRDFLLCRASLKVWTEVGNTRVSLDIKTDIKTFDS